MVRTWTDAIFDRTYGDVKAVQLNPDELNPKGCYNAVDLNRIESNTAYCIEYMLEHNIYRSDPHLTIREGNYWQSSMIPTDTEMRRIINNVAEIVEYTREKQVPEIANTLPHIIASSQMTYNLANDIERALDILHNQPNLPLDYFKLTLDHGTILTVLRTDGTLETINSNEVMIAEDEIATIRGLEYGEYAQYQTFVNWSADYDPLDIDALANYESKETTYTGQYRDVKFTANFTTRIPRQLSLTNAYISVNGSDKAESGPTSGTYYAGDNIMIIANRASNGKEFYEWLGTEEALHSISVADTDPSTIWLAMPDCDVTLYPHYINAGKHSVSVTDGSGGGWYDYNEYVFISSNDRGPKYQFSHWSGATSYLEDIHQDYQSFKMGDENISFRANYTYVYSYNDVTMINGLITVDGNAVSQATNLRESTSYTLVPQPVNNTLGLDYWELEGAGRINTDDLGNHTNTFVVGDGNAIITGHYNTLQNITVENINNGGGTNTYQVVRGHKRRFDTNLIVGDYIFVNWTIGETIVSTSTRYDMTVPSNDVTLRANYRLRNSVQIEIDYGNHTETVTMQERANKNIVADANPQGVQFLQWNYSNIHYIDNRYSASTYFTAGSGNGTITAVYQNTHTLTVNNGATSGTYKEGSSVTIDGNQAPSTYEFDYWEIVSGNGTIDNIYAKRTTYHMGTEDGEITAHYKAIPYFTVIVIDGYVQDSNGNWVDHATLLRNSTPYIKMKPAPEGKQFLQWEVLVGDNNDVYQPLAETTYIRNLTHNTTVQATYYVPAQEIPYTLTINRWTGEVDRYDNVHAGDQVEIYCSTPPSNMKFYRWLGDYQYLTVGQPAPQYYGGTYESPQIVNMPARNITLTEDQYKPLDWVVKYHLWMVSNSQCLYQTEDPDPEDQTQTVTTDHWVTDWEYPEGTVVQIRTIAIPDSKYFSEWQAVNDNNDDMRSYITRIAETPTTLVMPQDNMYVTPLTPDKDKYQMTVIDGGETMQQYEGGPVNIYFDKTDTNDIHYKFKRWTGDRVTQLKIYGTGRQFNVLTPGTSAQPQQVAMLPYAITLRPSYDTLYHLIVTNGSIDSLPADGPYYVPNSVVAITADPAPLGQKFQRWEGDTSGIANIYDPTTTVTTIQGITSIRAKYSLDTDQNDTGYVLTDLTSSNTILNEDITITSGELRNGFIITDSKGHIYVITYCGSTTSNITRLTKISKGGGVYE